MQLLISVVIALFATVVCIALLRPLALRLNFVDVPGGRKSHLGHVPLIGGIGMFVGLVFAVLFTPISFAPFRALFAGSALMILVGVLDDFNEMSAKLKLVMQIIAALVMANLGGVLLVDLGNLFFFGNIHLPFIASLIVTIIATLGVMNAVNMTDGSDGLAASVSFIEFSLLLYLSVEQGLYPQMMLLSIMLSVLVAYSIFNFPVYRRPRAWAFMGDAGSLLLGFILSWFLISLSQAPFAVAKPIVFVWIMAVPLFDATLAILRRVLAGASPFSPDAKHIHHLLRAKGCNRVVTVLFISAAALIMGVLGIVLDRYGVREYWMLLFFVLLFLLYALAVHASWQGVKNLEN